MTVGSADAKARSVVSAGRTIGALPAQKQRAIAMQAILIIQTVASIGRFGLAYETGTSTLLAVLVVCTDLAVVQFRLAFE